MTVVQDVLRKLKERPPEGADSAMNSDQGWHYQMPAYIMTLKRLGIRRSMSRKGICLDSAKTENFFSMVKAELY